jgi:hypothetical protein
MKLAGITNSTDVIGSWVYLPPTMSHCAGVGETTKEKTPLTPLFILSFSMVFCAAITIAGTWQRGKESVDYCTVAAVC